jgi:hypothetical protein
MKRRWLLLFAMFVVAVLVAGWLLVPFDAPRINQANYDKIQEGSTEKEVEELLGKPTFISNLAPAYKEWSSDDGNAIGLLISKARGVELKKFTPTDRTLFEQIKDRIQRRLRAMWP